MNIWNIYIVNDILSIPSVFVQCRCTELPDGRSQRKDTETQRDFALGTPTARRHRKAAPVASRPERLGVRAPGGREETRSVGFPVLLSLGICSGVAGCTHTHTFHHSERSIIYIYSSKMSSDLFHLHDLLIGARTDFGMSQGTLFLLSQVYLLPPGGTVTERD